jgi:hypothetical protein
MGVGGHPGHFPATVVSVSNNGLVTFKAAPEDVAYLKAQIGQAGTLDWNPSGSQPDAGNMGKSAS